MLKKKQYCEGELDAVRYVGVSRSEQMMSKVCQQKLKQNCLSIRFKHLATMYGEEASTIRKPLLKRATC